MNEFIVQTLIAARAKIDSGWCQKVFARDANGNSIAPNSDSAVAWCLRGAISSIIGSRSDYHQLYPIFNAIFTELIKDIRPYSSIEFTQWNDVSGRTKEEILNLYDRAIESQIKNE